MLPWFKRNLLRNNCMYVSGMSALEIGTEVGYMSAYKHIIEVDYSGFDAS